MKQLLVDYLVDNFAMYFLIIAFFAIIAETRASRVTRLRYIVFAICIAVTLSMVTALETWTSDYPAMIKARTLLSFIGFCLRPAVVLALILVLETRARQRIWLFIPELVNILAFIPCFFTDWVFTFDESYVFQRGPLGYSVFVAAAIYFVYFLYIVSKSYSSGKRREFSVLLVCSLCTVVGILLDVLFYGDNINISIIVCCLFYYLFLNSNYSGHDTLTGLLNRNAFYEDVAWRTQTVTAVATIDMNGLKEVNDHQGHAAGDNALRAIGEALSVYNNRQIAAYRVGGDEFMMIFRSTDPSRVAQILEEVKQNLAAFGIYIAAGFACNGTCLDFEALCRQSDEMMYADKRNYYELPNHNRRTNS